MAAHQLFFFLELPSAIRALTESRGFAVMRLRGSMETPATADPGGSPDTGRASTSTTTCKTGGAYSQIRDGL